MTPTPANSFSACLLLTATIKVKEDLVFTINAASLGTFEIDAVTSQVTGNEVAE